MKTIKYIILFLVSFAFKTQAQVNFDSTYNVGSSSYGENIHVFSNHYVVSGISTIWVFDSLGNLWNQGKAFLFTVNKFRVSLNINYYSKIDL